MKELQREYSPIPSKQRQGPFPLQEFDLSLLDPLGQGRAAQKISAAAKTLVYLFSPEIDLIEQLEDRLQNYDKLKKTKLILKQLASSLLDGRVHWQSDVLKTRETILQIEQEVDYFKRAVQVLEQDCHEKDQLLLQNDRLLLQKNKKIEEHHCTIRKLHDAYQEAKICWEKEIEQLRLSMQKEMTIKVRDEKGNPASARHNYLLPKHQPLNQTYTDRSVYIRFSSHSTHRHSPSPRKQQKSHRTCQHWLKLQNVEFQREALSRKLKIVEEELRSVAALRQREGREGAKEVQALKKSIQELKREKEARDCKIVEKNRIINQLLSLAQNPDKYS